MFLKAFACHQKRWTNEFEMNLESKILDRKVVATMAMNSLWWTYGNYQVLYSAHKTAKWIRSNQNYLSNSWEPIWESMLEWRWWHCRSKRLHLNRRWKQKMKKSCPNKLIKTILICEMNYLDKPEEFFWSELPVTSIPSKNFFGSLKELKEVASAWWRFRARGLKYLQRENL